MAKEILLIDDDGDELEVFSDALLRVDKNFKPFQAKNLEEAMAYLEAGLPAFIFIDYNMPRLNGLECLAALRALNKVADARIILYSNHITEAVRQKAIELGAFNCIQKPATINELSEKLIDVLDNQIHF